MADSHDVDSIFGYMPSDYFLMEFWDPKSSLPNEEQERDLVRAWINLGHQGRSTHHNQCRELGNTPLPARIPPTLTAFEKRKTVDPDEWSSTGVLWIRTWYGNEEVTDSTSPVELVTRTAADTAYRRLWDAATAPHGCDDALLEPYVFDDNERAYGVQSRDADDELELMGELPALVLSALMRCPDVMNGSGGGEIEGDEDCDLDQALLVVVADREACEDGWVLLVATNHRGQVLHMRVRCKASEVGLQVALWRDGGQPLDIGRLRENVMDYLDADGSGDGWTG